MRTIRILLFIIISTNFLTACSNMSGNVVPQNGPTMEQVYDGMTGGQKTKTHAAAYPKRNISYLPRGTKESSSVDREFRKLPNPELKMYVFPHVAGKEEVPIPGYYTAFSAYEQDHYALQNEMVRGSLSCC